MKCYVRLLLILWLTLPCLARPLLEVPSPRPSGWVTDTEHVLSPADLKALNQKLEKFHQRGDAEMAVVVVDSSDKMPSKQYAHQLLMNWGIGGGGGKNGVLLLLLERDQRIEVEVGQGLRQIIPDSKTSEILQTLVVPQIKAGHPAAAISTGVQAMLSVLAPEPVGILKPRPEPTLGEEQEPPEEPGYLGFFLLGFLPGLGLLAWLWGRIRPHVSRRRLPRLCAKCKRRMRRQLETDPLLEPGQRVEQRLKSVEFDIWTCDACKVNKVESYPLRDSPVGACKKCSYRTGLRLTSVVRPATCEADGSRLESFECKHCGNRWQDSQRLPRLMTSSGGSDSSGNEFGSSESGG